MSKSNLAPSVATSTSSLNSSNIRYSSKKDLSNAGENVMVSVRLRPLSEMELQLNHQHVWDAVPGECGTVSMKDTWKEKLRKTSNAADYVYDRVFIGSDNTEIYQTAVSDLVRSSMEGYNGTPVHLSNLCKALFLLTAKHQVGKHLQ
jgi:hypothetical protein